MEEQIKTILPDLEDEKKGDDKNTAKILMVIFIPIIVVIVLCFRYHTLRIIGLCLSGFLLGYTSYKSFKARENKFDKEILSQVVIILLTVLGIWFRFFGDLVLSYWTIALSCMLLMIVLKIENEKLKIRITYYVLIGSIITAIIVNYDNCILFLHRLFY